MNTLRLQLLADELRQQNPDLYMPSWNDCAAGFACRMPAFRAVGLRADRESHGAPRYHSDVGGLALMRFFDMDEKQAMRVFALKPVFFDITNGRRWARRIEHEIRRDGRERRWMQCWRQVKDGWNRARARAAGPVAALAWQPSGGTCCR